MGYELIVLTKYDIKDKGKETMKEVHEADKKRTELIYSEYDRLEEQERKKLQSEEEKKEEVNYNQQEKIA